MSHVGDDGVQDSYGFDVDEHQASQQQQPAAAAPAAANVGDGSTTSQPAPSKTDRVGSAAPAKHDANPANGAFIHAFATEGVVRKEDVAALMASAKEDVTIEIMRPDGKTETNSGATLLRVPVNFFQNKEVECTIEIGKNWFVCSESQIVPSGDGDDANTVRIAEPTNENTISFKDATINGNMKFTESTINGNMDFTESTINGNMDFGSATITGRMSFGRATITGNMDFGCATINGNMGFTRATITGDMSFTEATINGNMDFFEATITGNMSFNEATINGNMDFFSATINGNMDFGSATITGGLFLAGVKFGADKPDAKPVELIFTLAKIFGNGAQVSEWARLDLSGCRADFTDATLRRIDMTEVKLGSANLNRTTLALCTLDKADFSSALNVETAKFGVPLGHPHMWDTTSEFFNLKWGTAALDASAIEDEVAYRHFIVCRSQAEGLLPAGRRLEGVAECARVVQRLNGSDEGLQFHFAGSFQALDPKDQAVWGQKQYTEWGVEGYTEGHPGSTSRWNHQAAIPIGSIKLQVQRADNLVDKLEGILWLTEELTPDGTTFKMVPTTFFTVRAVARTSQKDPKAAPKEWKFEQYIISSSAVSAPQPRKAVRYSPGARISEINVPRSLAPSCFDAPDGNGHEMFQKLPYFPPWRSSKHGVGWFGFMGWYLSRYGSAENDLMLQDKSIDDLLDTFARMTTNSVTKENWTAYRLEWMVLRDMAQRTQKLDYNKGNDQSENEVMLNIVKLIFFSFERDIDRTSAPVSAEGQKTADYIKDIAKRVKAVWSSGNSSAHSWGSSPSEILDSIAVIAPCYLLGSPPPGVLQAFEDLERPLRGEILVDIKTVLNAERQRIKVIRDRHVNDSKTFGDVLLSALFAFFTFLGNFLYDVSTLRAWADDKYGSGY